MPLAELFARLEVMRSKFNLVDQSVSQTTLEQVFLGFAKLQHSEEEAKKLAEAHTAQPTPRPSYIDEEPNADSIRIIRTSVL